MESSLKKIDKNNYKLTVELGKEELAIYVKKTEDSVIQEIKIDGFRKGKAPRDAVRKQVGEQYILEQALEDAVQSSLKRALSEQEVEIINVSDLNIQENTASKLVYTVSLRTFPQITIVDLSKIKVRKKDGVVSDKEIDEAANYIITSRSVFIDKEEPIEKGDKVEIDFEVTSGGLPVEGGVSKNHPLIVGDNKFIPGFEDQLLGMKNGESKKFMLKAPKEYFHNSVAGKDLDFDIKIVKAQKIKKPVLDDNFAKSLGRFQNVEELKENIKKGILEEKKIEERQRLRLEVLSQILKQSKIELPKDMIDDKLSEMIVGFDNDLHAKGMELSFYLAHLNKNEDELRKDWRPEAEKQVSYSLILRKVAKDNNIVPSPQEVEDGVSVMIQRMTLKGEAKPQDIDVDKVREAIAADLTNEKVFSYLESKCAE